MDKFEIREKVGLPQAGRPPYIPEDDIEWASASALLKHLKDSLKSKALTSRERDIIDGIIQSKQKGMELYDKFKELGLKPSALKTIKKLKEQKHGST